MDGFSFADLLFIALVCALIYGIMATISRLRRRDGEAAPAVSGLTDEALKAILGNASSVAVVGVSASSERASHEVYRYLVAAGYDVYGVNPAVESILDNKCYPSLDDLPVVPYVVDVFRKPEHLPEIARQAAARGVKVLWMQEGIVNEEAAQIARSAGMEVIMDRCILKEHRRLGIKGQTEDLS